MSEESGFYVEEGRTAWFGTGAFTSNAEEVFQQAAGAILEYARANAPWADRTGDARNGLQVDVYTEGNSVILDLYHTIDYGLWLEVIQNGAFAIIMPTLENFAPLVFADAGGRVTSTETGSGY